MDNSFLKLFKEIYESEKLTLEPLGIEFKKLSAETITTILYPFLDLEEEPIYHVSEDVDETKVKELYKLYKKYEDKYLVRLALIGRDRRKVYELIRDRELIYKDDLIKTVFHRDEIFVTIKNDLDALYDIKENSDIAILGYGFDKIFYYNTLTNNYKIIDEYTENLSYLRYKNLKGIPNMLFMSLINSMGFAHIELQAVEAISFLRDEFIELSLNNINSTFIKSYIDKYKYNVRHDVIKEHDLFNEVELLLSSYSFNNLKDLDYDSAVKLYVK